MNLYKKYQNIIKCLTEYRKYTLDKNETFLDYDEFNNKIQLITYIKHKLYDKDNNEIIAYIFDKDTKFMNYTTDFKKIIDKHKNSTILLFTNDPLNIYLQKTVKKNNSNIYVYLHKHFVMELVKGPFCSKHEILSKEETNKVCFQLMAHGHRLPTISVNDPQCIWIGANVNDLIKITSESELTGESIKYRIVVPE